MDKGYHVPLQTKKGGKCTLLVYEVDKKLQKTSTAAWIERWRPPSAGGVGGCQGCGRLGGHAAWLPGNFPMEVDRKESLTLCSSQLATRWMSTARLHMWSCACMATVNSVGAEHFHPIDFIQAKALGWTCQPGVPRLGTARNASSGQTPSPSRRTMSMR